MSGVPHRLRSVLRRVAEAAVVACLPGGMKLAPVMWGVTGYLFPHEAVFLKQLAQESTGNGAIIEIGSMHGLSTLCLAAGLRQRGDRSQVVAIDPHPSDSEAVLRANLSRFHSEEFVRVVVGRSSEVAETWREPVRMVFIDGAHDIDSVTQDYDQWLPFVGGGGYLLLHDSTDLSGFAGPRLLAEERVQVGDTFDHVGRIGSITWGRKRGSTASWTPRVSGAAAAFEKVLCAVSRGS